MSNSEVDFDVIVVGAGIAGTVCALMLARDGHEVVLIERGSSIGSKNLSGGVLYSHVMEQVFPGFADVAPVERRVTRNVLGFLNDTSAVSLDFWDAQLQSNAFTVLRSKLDPWLAEQCEQAGVMVMPGVHVEELLRDGDQITGVRAGDDELRAHVVVAADGVNSLLAKAVGIRADEPIKHLAVGVKSVIGLSRSAIQDRFHVTGQDGVAYAFVGDCTQSIAGGGFLYTNLDSVSVGVVLRLDDLVASGATSSDVHDHFLAHPAIAPLLAGGDLLEYGCHLTIEDGPAMAKAANIAPGLVIIGDAAGFSLNTGLAIRGMDLAAGSAFAAAKAVSAALKAGDYSAAALGAYSRELAASFVGADMNTYARMSRILGSPRLYGAYGDLLADVLRRAYTQDATPKKHLISSVKAALTSSDVRLTQLLRDGWAAVRAL